MSLANPRVVWGPQPGSQVAVLSCPVFEALHEGTRGGGKTDTLLMDFLRDVGKGWGAEWRGILFRQTYPQLSDVINKSRKWFPRIFQGAKFTESPNPKWTFPEGETLLFRQFQRDADYWNYHGHAYPWIGWEELCNWATSTGFRQMMSCCRSTVPGLPKRVRSTTNPYGPGHNWVKHRYRLPQYRWVVIDDSTDDNGDREPSRIAIPSFLTENQMLLEADPEYVSRLRASARNETERRAWLKGDWDIVAGGMFDDVWQPRHNLLAPFRIPESWTIDRSFDWGSSRPFSVGWWAESDGSDVILDDGRVWSTVRGDLFRIAEWYGWTGQPNEGLRMLACDVAKGIVEREDRWGIHGRVHPGPADTSIFSAENGNCIASDMAEDVRLDDGRSLSGTEWTRADKRPGSRVTGWEQLRTALRNGHPPKRGVREAPGLFVFRTCGQFVRTVPVLPRDEKKIDDVDTDTEDHVADEVRYRVRNMHLGTGASTTRGYY